jgi:hypothetical protein
VYYTLALAPWSLPDYLAFGCVRVLLHAVVLGEALGAADSVCFDDRWDWLTWGQALPTPRGRLHMRACESISLSGSIAVEVPCVASQRVRN